MGLMPSVLHYYDGMLIEWFETTGLKLYCYINNIQYFSSRGALYNPIHILKKYLNISY